jgi:lipid II:glycine glycyltransferase (peptidoglycan interpeptide bridge formation enzyme)
MTRKSHGLPPQPVSFFKRILEHMICGGNGFIALAYMRETCIAGSVYLHFGDSAVYKFGASNKNFQRLRHNNLVMWEGIRECMRRGCRSFSFGRTEEGNEGLLQFKRGWGTKEERVSYHRYDLNRNEFEAETMKLKGFHNRIFEMTPIPVLRLLGAALYKHLG